MVQLMSAPARCWVRLESGRRINLLDPSPLDIEPVDLALGLSLTYRWGGSTRWGISMNVAHHSLLTLAIQRLDSPTGLAPRLALANLLHDAAEGIMRFDPLTPIKPMLGPGFEKLSFDLQSAIHLRFGLPAKLPLDWKKSIKLADRKAAAAEALHIAGWSEIEIRETLRIPLKPLQQDPLGGDPPWKPLQPSEASNRFLDMLQRLVEECQASTHPSFNPAPGLVA